MGLFAISGLLNGLAAIGLASFIYFRSPKDPRHWTFGLFGISTAIWSFGYFAWQISDSEAYALFNLRLLMAGAIFIPITFLHHVLYLLHKEISWKMLLSGIMLLVEFFWFLMPRLFLSKMSNLYLYSLIGESQVLPFIFV